MVCRSDSRVAVEAEGTLQSGPSPSELQTSPLYSLLCPVLRYNTYTVQDVTVWLIRICLVDYAIHLRKR